MYRNLKYNNINIDEFNVDKDIEACANQSDSTFNKLCIVNIYTSPSGNFTDFLNRFDLILQKRYNNKYNIVICGDVNVNYLINNMRGVLISPQPDLLPDVIGWNQECRWKKGSVRAELQGFSCYRG